MIKERSAHVTYEDIEKAAKYLEKDGRELTNANVYREIGRGSMTTINKFLQRYLNQVVDEVVAQISPAFLKAFTEEVIRVTDQRGAAMAKALSASHEYGEALEATVATLQKNAEDKEEELVRLKTEMDRTKTKVTELMQKLELAENTYIAKLQAAERMLESARMEAEAFRVTAVEQQVAYNDLLVKCTRFESTNTVLQEERDQLRGHHSRLQEKYDSLQELYRSSTLTAKGQEVKIETLAEQNNNLRTRIIEFEKELSKLPERKKEEK